MDRFQAALKERLNERDNVDFSDVNVPEDLSPTAKQNTLIARAAREAVQELNTMQQQNLDQQPSSSRIGGGSNNNNLPSHLMVSGRSHQQEGEGNSSTQQQHQQQQQQAQNTALYLTTLFTNNEFIAQREDLENKLVEKMSKKEEQEKNNNKALSLEQNNNNNNIKASSSFSNLTATGAASASGSFLLPTTANSLQYDSGPFAKKEASPEKYQKEQLQALLNEHLKSQQQQQQQNKFSELQTTFSPQQRRELLWRAERIVSDSVDPLFRKIAEKTKGHRENNAICVIVSASTFSRSVLSLHMERRGWTCICVSKTFTNSQVAANVTTYNNNNNNDDDDQQQEQNNNKQQEQTEDDLIESLKEVQKRFRYGQQSIRHGGKAKLGANNFDVRFSEEGGTRESSHSPVPRIRLVLIDSFTHELPQDTARNIRTITKDENIVVVQLTQIRSDGGRGLQLPSYVEPDPEALEHLIASGAISNASGHHHKKGKRGSGVSPSANSKRTRASSLTRNKRGTLRTSSVIGHPSSSTSANQQKTNTNCSPIEKVDVIVRSAFTSTLAEKISTFFLTEAARSRSRIVNVTSVYDSIRGILGGVSSRRFDSGDGIIGEMYDCFSPSSDLVQEMFRLKSLQQQKRGSIVAGGTLTSPTASSSLQHQNHSLDAFSAFASGDYISNNINASNINSPPTNNSLTAKKHDPAAFLSFESDPRFVVLRAHYQHMRKLLEKANEEIKGKEKRIRKLQDEVGSLTEEVKHLSATQEGIGVAALMAIPKETEDVGCSTADDEELGQGSWLKERNRLTERALRSEAKVKRLQELVSTNNNTFSATTKGSSLDVANYRTKIQELEEKVQDLETERNLLKEVANTAQKQWFEMAGSASARMESSLRGSVVFANAEAQRQSGRGALVIGGAAFSNVSTLVDQMKQQAHKIKHANVWKKGLREMLRIAESSALGALDVDANITRGGRRPTLAGRNDGDTKQKLNEFSAFARFESNENEDNNNRKEKKKNKKSRRRDGGDVSFAGSSDSDDNDDSNSSSSLSSSDSGVSEPFASNVPADALRKHKRGLVRVTGTKKKHQQQQQKHHSRRGTKPQQQGDDNDDDDQQQNKNNNTNQQPEDDGDYLLKKDFLKENSNLMPAGADRKLLNDTSFHYPHSSSDDSESGYFGDDAKAREKLKKEQLEAANLDASTSAIGAETRKKKKKYNTKNKNTSKKQHQYSSSTNKGPSSKSSYHSKRSYSSSSSESSNSSSSSSRKKKKKAYTMHESYQKLQQLSQHLDDMFQKVVDYTERAADARREGLDGLFDAIVRIAERSTKPNDASKIVKLREMVDEKQKQLDEILSRPLGGDQGSMMALQNRGDEFFKHYLERFHLVAELRRLEENCSVQHASRVKEHILRSLLTAQNRIDEVGSYLLNNNELFMYAEARMEVYKLLQDLAPWISSDEYELLQREGKSAISEMITKCQIARTTVEEDNNQGNNNMNNSINQPPTGSSATRTTTSVANPASNFSTTGRRRMSVSIAHFERTARALLGAENVGEDTTAGIPTQELAADLDREISRFVLDEGVDAIRDGLKQLRGMWDRDADDQVVSSPLVPTTTSTSSPFANRSPHNNTTKNNNQTASPTSPSLFLPPMMAQTTATTTQSPNSNNKPKNLHYIVNNWKKDAHNMVMRTAVDVGKSIEEFCRKEKEADEFLQRAGFDIRPYNRTIAQKLLHDPFSLHQVTPSGDDTNTNNLSNDNLHSKSLNTSGALVGGSRSIRSAGAGGGTMVDPSATNIRVVSVVEAFREASLLLHSQLRRLLLQLKRRTPLTKVKIVDFASENTLHRKKRIRQTSEFPALMSVDAELVSRFADYLEEETKGQYLLARGVFKAKAGEMMKSAQTQTSALHAIQEQARTNLKLQQRQQQQHQHHRHHQQQRHHGEDDNNSTPPPRISVSAPSASPTHQQQFNNTLQQLNASSPPTIDLEATYKSDTIANTQSVRSGKLTSSQSPAGSPPRTPLSPGALSMNQDQGGHFAKMQADGSIAIEYLEKFGRTWKDKQKQQAQEELDEEKEQEEKRKEKRERRRLLKKIRRQEQQLQQQQLETKAELVLEFTREEDDASEKETRKSETISVQVSEVEKQQQMTRTQDDDDDEEDEENLEEEEEEEEEDDQQKQQQPSALKKENGESKDKEKKSVKLPPLLNSKHVSTSQFDALEIEKQKNMSYFGLSKKQVADAKLKEEEEKRKALASFVPLPSITKLNQQLHLSSSNKTSSNNNDHSDDENNEKRNHANEHEKKKQKIIASSDTRFGPSTGTTTTTTTMIPSPPPTSSSSSHHQTARNTNASSSSASIWFKEDSQNNKTKIGSSAPSSSLFSTPPPQTSRPTSSANNNNQVDEGRIPGKSELPWARRVAVQKEMAVDRNKTVRRDGTGSSGGVRELARTSETTFGDTLVAGDGYRTTGIPSTNQNQQHPSTPSTFKPLKLVSSRPLALAPTIRTGDGRHTLVGGGAVSSSQQTNYNLVVVDDE